MSSSSKPILLFFGSGPKTGASTVKNFLANGYRVAQSSRSVKPEESTDEILYVVADVTNPKTVSAAFKTVRKTWGEPSVVVYNPYSAHYTSPTDTLGSISLADFVTDQTANITSAFLAAKEAVASFRLLPTSASRTFCYTGNCFNEQKPMPGLLPLGVGKSAIAYLIAEASESYKGEGFRFYFVDERQPDGSPMVQGVNGPAHAEFFLRLAKGEENVPWRATFVAGQGYKKFPWAAE